MASDRRKGRSDVVSVSVYKRKVAVNGLLYRNTIRIQLDHTLLRKVVYII